MSEVKLTIDEVIEHCKRKVQKYESCVDVEKIIAETGKETSFVKEYLEHKQVAEWLKALKRYQQQINEVLQRLTEEQSKHINLTVDKTYDDGLGWGIDYAIKVIKEVFEFESA